MEFGIICRMDRKILEFMAKDSAEYAFEPL